jgi:hypothetical protein
MAQPQGVTLTLTVGVTEVVPSPRVAVSELLSGLTVTQERVAWQQILWDRL